MANRFMRSAIAAALFVAIRAVGVAAAGEILMLQVDPASGLTLLRNQTAQTVEITGYRLVSETGALDVAGWNPIANGNELPAQFPPDNGVDDGADWEVALNPSSNELVEWYVTGSSPFHAGQQLNLGNAVNPAGMPALEFTYTLADETLIVGDVRYESIPPLQPAGDYNNDGSVDAADYVVWRKSNISGQQGYSDWRINFGRMAVAGKALASFASVPESASVTLVIIALLWILARRASEG
jgi:hypothetical protein